MPGPNQTHKTLCMECQRNKISKNTQKKQNKEAAEPHSTPRPSIYTSINSNTGSFNILIL